MNLSDHPLIQAYNMDCMDFMRDKPDNYYDLAIVDPPYGLGDKLTDGGTWASKYTSIDSAWDVIPDESYFSELSRVAVSYIIWGGNNFSKYISPARCFIVWRKLQMLGMHTMADCELALTSFDLNAKIYDGNNSQERIHPTQKPVALYRWLLKNYAKEGDKILDTHGGSFSSAIACHMEGFDLDICELDEDYFNDAVKRFELNTCQKELEFA